MRLWKKLCSKKGIHSWAFALALLIFVGEGMAASLEVVNGFGTGNYPQGSEVFIEAFPYDDTDPAQSGVEPANANLPVRIFDRWTGDTEVVANVYSARTTLTMPASNVVLTATYKDSLRWIPPRFEATIPLSHLGVIFMFHGGGGTARNMFSDDEIQSFILEAVSRGFGVVALDSIDRFSRTWHDSPDPAENPDLQRVAAAYHALIAEGRLSAGEPVYLLGVSNGGVLASLFEQNVQAALDFPVAAAAIYISSIDSRVLETTNVPTIFVSAENDNSTIAAQIAFNELVNRGVPSQIWINPPTPVHPGRFWRIDGLSLTHSNVLYDALRAGGFLDNRNYLIENPKFSGWERVIPAELIEFQRQVGDQLRGAYAEHRFTADLNDKVLDFFGDPATQVDLVPLVSGFDPISGVPGKKVMVFGDNFLDVWSVTFDGIPAEFIVLSGTQLRATVPFGASTGPIEVATGGGVGVSMEDFVIDGPTINGFDPLSGSKGTFVTITGNGFVAIDEVAFGGVPASVGFTTSSKIRVRVPDGAQSGPVTVSNYLGTAVSPVNFQVVPR